MNLVAGHEGEPEQLPDAKRLRRSLPGVPESLRHRGALHQRQRGAAALQRSHHLQLLPLRLLVPRRRRLRHHPLLPRRSVSPPRTPSNRVQSTPRWGFKFLSYYKVDRFGHFQLVRFSAGLASNVKILSRGPLRSATVDGERGVVAAALALQLGQSAVRAVHLHRPGRQPEQLRLPAGLPARLSPLRQSLRRTARLPTLLQGSIPLRAQFMSSWGNFQVPIFCSITNIDNCPVNFWCHIGARPETTLCCPGATNPCSVPLAPGNLFWG